MARIFSLYIQRIGSPLTLFACVSATVILVIAGPFDTSTTLTFGHRVLYWGMVCATSIVVATFVRVLQEESMPDLPVPLQTLVVSMGMTAVYTPFLYLLAQAITGHRREVTPFSKMVAVVFLATATIVLIERLIVERHANGPRLAARLGGIDAVEILHLAAEDHYVHVTTGSGTIRLLMRFSDAIDELDGVPGLRVHRSHWVAAAAVKDVRRANGQLRIELSTGAEVPVSRGHESDVLDRLTA